MFANRLGDRFTFLDGGRFERTYVTAGGNYYLAEGRCASTK
jgi:hypothetical protein